MADGRSQESWTLVAHSNEVAGEGPHAASAHGVDLVLVRHRGELRAFEGKCPHQGALLGEGELDGERLICRNHRWAFDLATGQRVGGPQCLRSCPVRQRGGKVEVDVSRLRSSRGPNRPSTIRRKEDLPSPPGLPLLGHTPQLARPDLHRQLEAWADQYGSMFLVRFGRHPTVVLRDPELTQQVLRDRPKTFRRASNVEAVLREIGAWGVFAAEGEAWRPQRRLTMRALSHKNLRAFYPTLSSTARRLHARWTIAANEGRVVDMRREFMAFTTDVTTTLAFGRDLNTIDRGDTDIGRHLANILPAVSRRITAPFPYWHYIKLGSDKTLEESMRAVQSWVATIVRDTRAELARHHERADDPRNFMEAMLMARDEHGRPFTDEVLFGNAINMLVAGEDTTANTLAWTVHLLCDTPAAARRLQAEADEQLGEHRVPPSLETIQSLRYAGAAGEESMRMRPVAPFMLLEAIEPVLLGDLQLEAGDGVMPITRMADEAVASPHTFAPQRWLEGSGGGAALMRSGQHLPFGSGPRICPGRSLALLEIRMVLATLYRNFDVERVGWSSDVRERFEFTMAPSKLPARLHLRTS